MKNSKDFRRMVLRFLKQSGMAPTTFGRRFVGDPNFIRDMFNGRNFSILMIDKIERLITAEERKRRGKSKE